MGKTVYGPEVREAALTLHLEGLSSAEIRRRLKDGNAGLPYSCEPGERTIDNWRRGWKREGQIAGMAVREGDEQVIEDVIYRRILGLYRKEIQDLEDAMIDGKARVGAVSRISKFQAIVDATRYQRQLRAKSREQKLTPEEGGHLGKASGETKSESMLERLARAEQTRHTEGDVEAGISDADR